MSEQADLQLFNLDTMSGVQTGMRTAVFQRIRLVPVDSKGTGSDHLRWARVLWHDDLTSCTVHLYDRSDDRWNEKPLVTVKAQGVDDMVASLLSTLEESGWRTRLCGSCRHWGQLRRTSDEHGIPLGQCGWRDGVDQASVEPPLELLQQSSLALDCPAWQTLVDEVAHPLVEPGISSDEEAATGIQQRIWSHLRRFVPFMGDKKPDTWRDRIVERSGEGTGTEPCFACHGRIANLGALTVSTDEGDKRTFSVWRCRTCLTYYLNDWIDRWERKSTLETEETYYRLAPVEAFHLLALFQGVEGGEHPGGRQERGEERRNLEAFVSARPRLSHQIKQGR